MLTKEEAVREADKINGYMRIPELEFLWDIHSDPSIKLAIEVGSFLGRSTNIIASALDGHGVLVSVDPHEHIFNRNGMNNESSWPHFLENIQKKRNAIALKTTSGHAAQLIGTNPCVVFIDGNHRYEAVNFDIYTWAPRTRRLLLHDYNPKGGPGIIRAANELIKRDNEWRVDKIVSSLAYLTKGELKH